MAGGRLLAGSSPPGTCIQKAVASCPTLPNTQTPFPSLPFPFRRKTVSSRAREGGEAGVGVEGKNGAGTRPTPNRPTHPVSVSPTLPIPLASSPTPPLSLSQSGRGVFSTVPRVAGVVAAVSTLLGLLCYGSSLSLSLTYISHYISLILTPASLFSIRFRILTKIRRPRRTRGRWRPRAEMPQHHPRSGHVWDGVVAASPHLLLLLSFRVPLLRLAALEISPKPD